MHLFCVCTCVSPLPRLSVSLGNDTRYTHFSSALAWSTLFCFLISFLPRRLPARSACSLVTPLSPRPFLWISVLSDVCLTAALPHPTALPRTPGACRGDTGGLHTPGPGRGAGVCRCQLFVLAGSQLCLCEDARMETGRGGPTGRLQHGLRPSPTSNVKVLRTCAWPKAGVSVLSDGLSSPAGRGVGLCLSQTHALLAVFPG